MLRRLHATHRRTPSPRSSSARRGRTAGSSRGGPESFVAMLRRGRDRLQREWSGRPDSNRRPTGPKLEILRPVTARPRSHENGHTGPKARIGGHPRIFRSFAQEQVGRCADAHEVVVVGGKVVVDYHFLCGRDRSHIVGAMQLSPPSERRSAMRSRATLCESDATSPWCRAARATVSTPSP